MPNDKYRISELIKERVNCACARGRTWGLNSVTKELIDVCAHARSRSCETPQLEYGLPILNFSGESLIQLQLRPNLNVSLGSDMETNGEDVGRFYYFFPNNIHNDCMKYQDT